MMTMMTNMYIGGASPCKLPKFLTVTAATQCRQVNLAWSPTLPGQIFNVWRGVDLIFSNLGTTFTDTPPGNGQYTYLVTTETHKRNCRTQGSTTATVNAPTAITLTASVSCKNVGLSWNSVGTNAVYTLKKGTTIIYSGPGTSYTDSGLANGTYGYTISAILGDCPAVTATASATINVPAYGSLISTGACSGSYRTNTYANGSCGTYTSQVQDCAGCCPAAGTLVSAGCVNYGVSPYTWHTVTANGCCGTNAVDTNNDTRCGYVPPFTQTCGSKSEGYSGTGSFVGTLTCTVPAGYTKFISAVVGGSDCLGMYFISGSISGTTVTVTFGGTRCIYKYYSIWLTSVTVQ